MQRCGHARCPCCSHEEGDRITFWFCCQCGNGPNSDWNPCCSGESPLRSSKPHAQSTDGDQHEVVNGDTDRARYPPVEDDSRTEHGDGSQSTSIATRPSGHPYSETKSLDPSDEHCSPDILGEQAVIELEKVANDDAHDERLQIQKPDQVDDARSDRSEPILENGRSMDRFKDLYVSGGSSDEEEREHVYQMRKLRWTEGMIPRWIRNRSVEGDSTMGSYAGSDSEDGNHIESRRRTRRKLRQHDSIVFEEKGSANTNNIEELEESEEGLSQQRRGTPSIPDDDAFTLDELSFRGGLNEWYPWPAQMKATLKASGSASSGYDSPILPSPSSEDDGRSIQSLESSTTLVSTLSGFTVVELEGATVELQGIFQKDADLVSLYRQGIKDASIGPERLQRNVVRLLRLFARDLRQEARQELEKMASRFVSTKARYIAQCIVEEYHDQAIEQEPHQLKAKQKETECDDRQRNEDQEELDDVDDLVPVDEDLFEDLPTLRTFLVNSAAFQVFREELTKFVLPKELRSPTTQSTKEGATTMAQPVDRWYYHKTVGLALKATLVAAGCLEPPLQAGMIRLRWQCVSPPD